MTIDVERIPVIKSEIEQELCRRSYEYYVKYVHKRVYIKSKFGKFITNTVQDFIEQETDKAYEILCLSVPSQHGKSMHITETLPSWILGNNPRANIIMASYNEEFAGKFLRRNSQKLESYKDIFNLNITKDTSTTLETKEHGAIISRGLLSGITGNPANYIIIDDPIKNRKEARSQTIRDSIFDEWMSSIKTRLAPKAKIIVIQTRWHKEDLIGKIMQTEKNVRYINFPVICLKDSDEMGRVRGEMLCSEIGRDIDWWNDFKIAYEREEGSEALNSIYYGNPTNIEGGIVKRGWLKKYKPNELPRIMHMAISVDATFGKSDNSDFVSIQVWGKSNNKYYLMHRIKERMTFRETVIKIQQVAYAFSEYDEILIEKKANGDAIIDVLNQKYNCIIAIVPRESKEARLQAVAPMIEAGQVFIRAEDYSLEDEVVDFPNSDHDDEVDAMSQALNRLRNVYADIPEREYIDDNYDEELESVLNF